MYRYAYRIRLLHSFRIWWLIFVPVQWPACALEAQTSSNIAAMNCGYRMMYDDRRMPWAPALHNFAEGAISDRAARISWTGWDRLELSTCSREREAGLVAAIVP